MSSGEGTITLLNDTIYAEVIYTYKDPSALWYLDHANIFYLCDKETPSLFGKSFWETWECLVCTDKCLSLFGGSGLKYR